MGNTSKKKELEREFGTLAVNVLFQNSHERYSVTQTVSAEVLTLNYISYFEQNMKFESICESLSGGSYLEKAIFESGFEMIRRPLFSFTAVLPPKVKDLFETTKTLASVNLARIDIQNDEGKEQFAQVYEVYSPNFNLSHYIDTNRKYDVHLTSTFLEKLYFLEEQNVL